MKRPEKLPFMALMHMTAGARLVAKGDNFLLPTAPRRKRFRAWAVVSCKCTLHTIGISKKGRVALLDHTREEVKRWTSFVALGGTGCPDCLKWLKIMANDHHISPLKTFGRGHTEGIPCSLDRVIVAAKMKRLNRRMAKDKKEGKK